MKVTKTQVKLTHQEALDLYRVASGGLASTTKEAAAFRLEHDFIYTIPHLIFVARGRTKS